MIKAIRGMNDILPPESLDWSSVENVLKAILAAYGYEEIRLPLLEATELFLRSVGEVTDIVEKETYTFLDRNQTSVTLRPEGTAGCVRSLIEQGVLQQQPVQRLWYSGPMFRHERPQKGRYRQFHQLGVEVFGLSTVDISLELLLLCQRFWKALGLSEQVTLEINSLGSLEARARYRQALVTYFTEHQTALDEDSQHRLHTNPLRILDSKNPAMKDLIAAAPQVLDYLDETSAEEFEQLKSGLNHFGIQTLVNPRLVRGLDYYTGLVFEWVTDRLGSQATVCAGGRYDALVGQLGGPQVPAIGLALGLERLILLAKEVNRKLASQAPALYLVSEPKLRVEALVLAEELRAALPGWRILTHCGEGHFKHQFKKADKSGALFAVILGEEEHQNHQLTVKSLRQEGQQFKLSKEEVIELIKKEG